MPRRKSRLGLCLAVGVGLVAVSAASQAADMANPELLASNCFNCHGADGNSVGTVTGLNTLSAGIIATKMRMFKKDKALTTIMDRIAKGYSEAEIAAIAGYFERVNK